MRSLFVALGLAVAACGPSAHSSTTVENATATEPDVVLTEASLSQFYRTRFAAQLGSGALTADYGSPGTDQQVVGELAAMGITTVSGLAAIVPADYDTKGFGAIAASADPSTNFAGLSRDLMLIADARRYVELAWKDHWSATSPEDFPAVQAYGVDLQILVDAGVFGGGHPCQDP